MTPFERWLNNRNKPETIEYIVRRISSRGRGYQVSIEIFKITLLAEMFCGNGGNLTLLAEEIGIHRNSISRLFKGYGFDKRRMIEVAKRDQESK